MPVLKVKEASNLETNTYGPRKLSSPPLALKKTLNEACSNQRARKGADQQDRQPLHNCGSLQPNAIEKLWPQPHQQRLGGEHWFPPLPGCLQVPQHLPVLWSQKGIFIPRGLMDFLTTQRCH